MRANAHVEICRIIDEDASKQQKGKHTATPTLKQKKKGRKREEVSHSSGCKERVNDREHQLDSDTDGDHLAESQPKRRKLGVDETERWTRIINAPPGTSLSI